MKISERCRAYEQKFPFTPCEGDTKVETNTKGWSRHKQYSIPNDLLKLEKNKESAFLTLKLVEIIGEDEAYSLDPETIYFITYLLNQNNLRKIRNDILISALPQRS